MNFPKPFRWAGKNIRTFHLGNSRVVAMRNRYLPNQIAERNRVGKGARRKASCVLRNPHALSILFSGLFMGQPLARGKPLGLHLSGFAQTFSSMEYMSFPCIRNRYSARLAMILKFSN